MHRCAQIVSVADSGFRMWRKNPRIFLTFALAFILCYLLSDKSVRFAQNQNTYLQLVEPFVWTFGDAQSILAISLLLVLLLADVPFITPATPFYLSRITRRIWLAGQILYVTVATALFTCFLLLSTVALCAHLAFPGNQWSETAAMLGYSGVGVRIGLPASKKTMEMTTPYECAAQIFVLILLYTLTLVSLMLAVSIWKGRTAGLVSAFVFSLFGLLLTPDLFIQLFDLAPELQYRANVLVGWLSPLNEATYQMHSFGYDQLPKLWQSYAIFGTVIGTMFVFALAGMRRYNFVFTGGGTE